MLNMEPLLNLRSQVCTFAVLRGLSIVAACTALVGFARNQDGAEPTTSVDAEHVEISACESKFSSPNDWLQVDRESMLANLKMLDEQKANLPKLLASHRKALDVVTYTAYDFHGHKGLVPTIKVTVLPNPNESFADFQEAMKISLRGVADTLRNSVVTDVVSTKKIGERKAVHFSFEFDVAVKDGSEYRVSTRTYAIPCRGVFLQVTKSEQRPATHDKAFDDFMASFSFR